MTLESVYVLLSLCVNQATGSAKLKLISPHLKVNSYLLEPLVYVFITFYPLSHLYLTGTEYLFLITCTYFSSYKIFILLLHYVL